jgi:sensor domain CHASE-containing protein
MSLPAIVAETAVAHHLQIHGVLARSTELPIAVGISIAVLIATVTLTIAPWSELQALAQQPVQSALTIRKH